MTSVEGYPRHLHSRTSHAFLQARGNIELQGGVPPTVRDKDREALPSAHSFRPGDIINERTREDHQRTKRVIRTERNVRRDQGAL